MAQWPEKEETIVPRFVNAALRHPAIPLTEVRKRIDAPSVLAARGRVTCLMRASTGAREMARGAEGLARAIAANIVAQRSPATPLQDRLLTEDDMLDAVLPLAYAVIARDRGEGHPAIGPLLDLAKRVAPRLPV